MNNTRESNTTRLNKVFCEVFDNDAIQISDATTANDIDEWDSMTHIVLVVSIEKEFGATLSASEIRRLKNVGEILDILETRSSK
jgi:acyl carrier protein